MHTHEKRVFFPNYQKSMLNPGETVHCVMDMNRKDKTEFDGMIVRHTNTVELTYEDGRQMYRAEKGRYCEIETFEGKRYVLNLETYGENWVCSEPKNVPHARCPWCGTDMRFILTSRGGFMFECKNRECSAHSPASYSIRKAVLAAAGALHRPMSADEARAYVGMCVLEYESYHGFRYLAVHDFMETAVQDKSSPKATVARGTPKDELMWENYNIKWRVWKDLPTAEERKAADWDSPEKTPQERPETTLNERLEG